ncbi:MAG: hypothetical protein JW731_09495 [Bacteroidales bacterium]|nr:hypothetical protein [Bacteroidales bacterium]
MEDPNCPNYNSCRLVNLQDFKFQDTTRKKYIEIYCSTGEANWNSCKRYLTKKTLGFCPDFVLPDTTLSLNEIIEKFDEESLT